MIAPSKLGELVAGHWEDDGDAGYAPLISALRSRQLVRDHVGDAQLRATFERAHAEDAALEDEERAYNSPHERVRVFLEPYLTPKGRRWAVPLQSLDIRDGE
jgi:hypothetical protein